MSSILVDIFSSLANKIRSKLGTSITYTPTEAISAIDDVYTKGVTDTQKGNATAADVLADKTFTSNTAGVEISGTMPDYSASSNIPVVWGTGGGNTTPAMRLDSDGLNYRIAPPKGYWAWSYDNSSIIIPAETKSATPSTSAQTITPTNGNMLKSVSVSAISPTKAAATYNTSTSDQTIAANQYLTGAQTIKGVATANISAGNIKDGVTVTVGDANSATRIKNVTGTFTDSTTVSSGQTAAAAAQILTGYSAWVDGAEKKGSMTNQGAKTSSLDCGESYTIPKGYHNGSGKVTANSLASQTKAATDTSGITAATVLSGRSGWYNGNQIVGSMTNRGAVSKTLNPGGSYTVPAGYHNGSGTVEANENTGTYTFASGSTGGKTDLGASNTYRYVTATNVYNKGKEDGAATRDLTIPSVRCTGGGTGNGLYTTYLELNTSGYDSLYVGSYAAAFASGFDTAVSKIDKYQDSTWTTLLSQQQNVTSKTLEKTYNISSATKIRIYVATYGQSSYARFNTIKLT